jgi:NTE family protein
MKPQLFCLLVLTFFCGCTCPYVYHPTDEPPELPQCIVPQKIRLALVLGGGGAKGLAHIGVLEEFEKANIPIDIIIGCSAGSLVGAVYCDTPNAAYVRSVLEPMEVESFLDINIFKAWYGLSQGHAMNRTLHRCIEAKEFHELQIPLLVVATDLYSGQLVTFGGGPIIPAIQASTAIPIVYSPVELHGRVCVDGGVVDPVPVRIAQHLNSEIIVAVDLRGLLDHTFPQNMFGIAKRSAEITLLWQSETCIKEAHVVIRPNLNNIGTFQKGLNEQIYEAGRQAAVEVIPTIQALLKKREIT